VVSDLQFEAFLHKQGPLPSLHQVAGLNRQQLVQLASLKAKQLTAVAMRGPRVWVWLNTKLEETFDINAATLWFLATCLSTCMFFILVAFDVGLVGYALTTLSGYIDTTPGLHPYLPEALHPKLRPSIGAQMHEEGATKHHPVIMVPGLISTGLELWQGEPCIVPFRRRIWGGSDMLKNIVADRECWLRHMQQNESTWSDPFGKRVRAASGLSAADYFLSPDTYYIWGPIIANLAELGYDESSLFLAAYDWRLSYRELEARDRFFTRLADQAEFLVKANGGRKAVVVAHSMGCTHFFYFLQVRAMRYAPAHPPCARTAHCFSLLLCRGACACSSLLLGHFFCSLLPSPRPLPLAPVHSLCPPVLFASYRRPSPCRGRCLVSLCVSLCSLRVALLSPCRSALSVSLCSRLRRRPPP
jgi:hypothetical protein